MSSLIRRRHPCTANIVDGQAIRHVRHPSQLSGVAPFSGMHSGRERTEQDWRDLLAATGFLDIVVHDTASPVAVVEAVVDNS